MAQLRQACGTGPAARTGARCVGARLAVGARTCGARVVKRERVFLKSEGLWPPSWSKNNLGRAGHASARVQGGGRKGGACGGAGAGAGQSCAVVGVGPGKGAWAGPASSWGLELEGSREILARAGPGAARAGAGGCERVETRRAVARAKEKSGGGAARARAGRREAAQAWAAQAGPGARRPARARQGLRGAKHACSGAGQGQGCERNAVPRWRLEVVVGGSRADD